MNTVNYSLSELQELSPTIVDRFWEKVNKNGPTPQHCPERGPCWEWTGVVNSKGYGQLFVTKHTPPRRLIYAHRLAWIIRYGRVPDGMWVLHHCDNPRCVAVDRHCFLGTVVENARDQAVKGRSGLIKYSIETVASIRAHPEMTCRELAKAFGVSASQAWNIRTHKHRPVVGEES